MTPIIAQFLAREISNAFGAVLEGLALATKPTVTSHKPHLGAPMNLKICRLTASLFSLALLSSAQAGKVEVRFYPATKVWSHPLENARQINSVVLQNTAIVNHSDKPVTLQALRIDLLGGGSVVQSRFIDATTLDALAKGGAALGASGMLQLVDFQFAPKQLFGADKPTLTAHRTLAPDSAFYLPQQLLAFNGKSEQLRVSVEFSGDNAPPVPASGTLEIRHGSAPGKYRFPLEGRWWVAAGATPHSHHRWAVPEEFALDILQIGANGLSYRGNGSKMRDYYAYGAAVLAAADGEVVAVLNNVPDNTGMLRGPKESLQEFRQRLLAGQDAMLTGARESIPGNHVILRHDVVEGGPVYSLYAHLQPNSSKLKVGDQVKVGDRLGKLGGSGNSTEPHLHFQLCDAPDALNCAGMPVNFDNVEIPLSDWDRAIQSGDTVVARP